MANGHGGKREGAGRKPKSDEQQLIEKLKPYEQDALNALVKSVKADKSWAVKLFMEYMYGKPKETVHQTHAFSDFSIKDVLRFGD